MFINTEIIISLLLHFIDMLIFCHHHAFNDYGFKIDFLISAHAFVLFPPKFFLPPLPFHSPRDALY